jgi:hypothetical protein
VTQVKSTGAHEGQHRLSAEERAAIDVDIRAGLLTNTQVALKHGVHGATVSRARTKIREAVQQDLVKALDVAGQVPRAGMTEDQWKSFAHLYAAATAVVNQYEDRQYKDKYKNHEGAE